MKLHLASAGAAMAALALSSQSMVSAVRSEHALRAMDVNAATAVECKAGQQTLDIKAVNGTASFKCGTDLVLDPEFQTEMTAYESTNSTAPVLLTKIVPNAKFTRTEDAAPQSKTDSSASPPGGASKVATYHLNVPELPAADKTVVFKCVGKTQPNAPTPEQSAGAFAAGTPETQGCLMIINVAKSAASFAASPIAAAGSIALAVLASVIG